MRTSQKVVVAISILFLLGVLSFWLSGTAIVEKPRHAVIESNGGGAVEYTSSELPSDAVIVNSTTLNASQMSELYASIDDPKKEVRNTAGLTNDSFVSSGESFYRVEVVPRGANGGGQAVFRLISAVLFMIAAFFAFSYLFDWMQPVLEHECGERIQAPVMEDGSSSDELYWASKQEVPSEVIYQFWGECPNCGEELGGPQDRVSVRK